MAKGIKVKEKMLVAQTTLPESVTKLCRQVAADEYVYPAQVYRRWLLLGLEVERKKK